MEPKMLERLRQDISAVCRNDGVAVYEPDDPPTEGGRTEPECLIYPVPDVTTGEELDAGYLVFDTFDRSPEAQAAWEAEELEDEAILGETKKDPVYQYFRALCREIHDQVKEVRRVHNNIAPANQQAAEVSWQQTVDLAKARIEGGSA